MSDTQAEPAEDGSLSGEFELLISVAARINRIASLILASLDTPLTFRQYRTLSRLRNGFSSLRQLAKRGNLSIPTVSENIDGLVKRGLVSTRHSESDRRAIVLSLTEAGETAQQAGELALDGFMRAVHADLDEPAREEFNSSLKTVYEEATRYFNDVHLSRSS